MDAAANSVEKLRYITAGELSARADGVEATGSKAAFLGAARGVMSKEEAAKFRKLIDDGCERIEG